MKIILCDLSHKRDGRFSSEYIPYPVACIKSYFTAYYSGSSDYTFDLVKDPDELTSAIESLTNHDEPLIVGFSCYMWNHNLSLAFATAIKKVFPNSVIIFGGPDFPLEIEEKKTWLLDRLPVDIFIEGEGEKPFLSVVETLCACDFRFDHAALSNIPSIFLLSHDRSKLMFVPDLARDGFLKSSRVENLDATPSPYLMGYLDKFLIDGNLVPLMESNRGCPFTCTFCVDGNAARTKVFKVHPNRLGDELEYIASRYKGSTLALADTNFGMYKEDLVFCKMLNDCRRRTGYPTYINTSTGKNQKERIIECAELVSGALRVAASVQTLDPTILKNIKRSNISSDQLVAMSERLSGGVSNTYAELILGLPGDSIDKHLSSVKQCIDAGYNQIRMHTLTLLNGSVMGTQEDRRAWGMQTQFRGLQRCFGTYSLFGIPMHVIETEEVVVAQKSMPFSDYIQCRLFNLTVAVFYNEEVLREFFVFLARKELKASEFVDYIWKNIKNDESILGELFRQFAFLTESELYSSATNIIDKFSDDVEFRTNVMQGRVGHNLLLDTQGEILISHFDSLVKATLRLITQFCDESSKTLSEDEILILTELGRFISLKRRDVFNVDEQFVDNFDASLLPYTSLDKPGFDNNAPNFLARFYFDPNTAKFISDQAKTYGKTREGIGKIIARSPIKDFQRKVEIMSC